MLLFEQNMYLIEKEIYWYNHTLSFSKFPYLLQKHKKSNGLYVKLDFAKTLIIREEVVL